MHDKLNLAHDRIDSISEVVGSFSKRVEASESAWECVKRALEDVVLDFKVMKQKRKRNGINTFLDILKICVILLKCCLVQYYVLFSSDCTPPFQTCTRE